MRFLNYDVTVKSKWAYPWKMASYVLMELRSRIAKYDKAAAVRVLISSLHYHGSSNGIKEQDGGISMPSI